jgi:hypothetical protein
MLAMLILVKKQVGARHLPEHTASRCPAGRDGTGRAAEPANLPAYLWQ